MTMRIPTPAEVYGLTSSYLALVESVTPAQPIYDAVHPHRATARKLRELVSGLGLDRGAATLVENAETIELTIVLGVPKSILDIHCNNPRFINRLMGRAGRLLANILAEYEAGEEETDVEESGGSASGLEGEEGGGSDCDGDHPDAGEPDSGPTGGDHGA